MRRTIPLLSMILLAGAVALAPVTSQAAKTKKPSTTSTSAKGASKTVTASPKSKAAAASGKVDINTASKEDLAKLPVIGDAIAAKIVAGRPYKTKRDLVTKKVLTTNQYAKVKDLIIAKQ